MAANKDKLVVNPLNGQPYFVPDVDRGIILQNTIDTDTIVPDGYTFIKRNSRIEAGTEVRVEQGGEFYAK